MKPLQNCVVALCLATSLPLAAAPAAESSKPSMPENISGFWKNTRGSILDLKQEKNGAFTGWLMKSEGLQQK